ncbi:MAG: hypothetical protein UU93_C0012G0004 [Candidatus Amesbacteria bacterium GW2011_GWA2_42_12]|uniref:Uncharacterized protein n=1 Tax=Candidatus Amesbacteria bacterium GW2011_GWA2_42_12 TaxID=1618356 RepID=A0A0G0Y5D5_9BACT|nr:MAG: hypothetical protein UU93_C0012G0004 [Candidatus Amesbacteria bacterium GW2011_GWA2_42_12]
MIRTQVYIPDDLYALTLLKAQEGNMNFSEVLRLGLTKVVGKTKNKKKGFLLASLAGALKNGPKDLSATVDDIYK